MTYPCLWFCVYDVKRRARGATRNNLIFNDVRIFRVGDPVTLKMLNSFMVSLLRGAPYYLLFNIGKFFSGLFSLRLCRWNTWAK